MLEIKDYTSLDINEFLVSRTSVINEYAQTDALAVDQMFEGVPGGSIIFGGLQIRKKEYSDTTSAGVWVGVDKDGVGKINIGDSTDFLLWNGTSLVISGSITATSGTIGGWTIGATTLTGGGVTLDSSGIVQGGIVRTSASGQRVQMLSSTNTMQILNSSGVVRSESYSNGWQFNNTAGGAAGRVFIESTFNNLQIQALSSDLFLTSVDDIAFAPGNGSITMYIDANTKNLVMTDGDLVLGNTTIIGGGSWTLTLPSTNGSSGEFLQTDGLGNTTWASVSGGANTSLSNLSATAINTDLVPDADGIDDLGSAANHWSRLYIEDIYLKTTDATIRYGSTIGLDFYSNHLRLGSSYTDFSPASALGGNLGANFKWNNLNVDTVDAGDVNISGDADFSTGEYITGGADLNYHATSDHIFYIGGVLKAIIDANIFTEGDLLANGTKPFVIDHPDGSGRLLRYTAQESPEVLLRHRGKATTDELSTATITLPTHFTLVTDPAGDVTVNLTAVGDSRVYLHEEPTNSTIKVRSDGAGVTFHYEVIAVRNGFLNQPIELDPTDTKLSDGDKNIVTQVKSMGARNVAAQEQLAARTAKRQKRAETEKPILEKK